MDFGALAESIADQFVTVWNAPVPFLAVCIALWLGMRWFIKGQFDTRLANAQSTIEMLEKKLDRRERSEVFTIAATQAAHEAASSNDEDHQHKIEQPRDLSEIPEVRIGASDLMKLVKNRTKLQAQPFLDDHIGRVMTVTGEVRDAAGISASVMVSMMVGENLVFAYFQHGPKVQALRQGETVKVRGILSGVGSYGFDLTDCEFA